jgi:hypothetical protein
MLAHGSTLHIPDLCTKTQQQILEQKQNILKDPKVTQVQFDHERQTPAFISLKKAQQTYANGQAKPVLDNYLNVRQGIDDLVISREVKLTGDISVLEFHQYYKGIKVEHARYTAYTKRAIFCSLMVPGTTFPVVCLPRLNFPKRRR